MGLEDHIEFCVQMSDQAERLDCNFYLCAACVSSRADALDAAEGAAADGGAENEAEDDNLPFRL